MSSGNRKGDCITVRHSDHRGGINFSPVLVDPTKSCCTMTLSVFQKRGIEPLKTDDDDHARLHQNEGYLGTIELEWRPEGGRMYQKGRFCIVQHSPAPIVLKKGFEPARRPPPVPTVLGLGTVAAQLTEEQRKEDDARRAEDAARRRREQELRIQAQLQKLERERKIREDASKKD